jgi:transposase
MGKAERAGYLTDVSDEEWAFVLPYLLLSREDNASRQHDLRAIYNAVRYIVKGGNQWRLMPHDLPPWPAINQPRPVFQNLPVSSERRVTSRAR